jgi:hypothetical protein
LKIWHFFLFLTQMREKTFTGKIFSQVSMHVAFLPLPVLGAVNLATVGGSTISTKYVAGSIIVRHMWSIHVPSLPLRVYDPMRSTHNALK